MSEPNSFYHLDGHLESNIKLTLLYQINPIPLGRSGF